jgi:hypothetical protein
VTTTPIVPRRHFGSSLELRQYVRETFGPDVMLGFSRGKDAIAAWAEMEGRWDRIIPVYHYLVPGLEFEEESLLYFEQAFGAKIIRLPAPATYRILNALAFQAPENCATVERFRLPTYTYADLWDHVREQTNAPNAMTATGTRAAESPVRRMSVRKHGALNPTKRGFWAIYDWKMDDVVAAITKRGIKLPIEYRYFGRSFDGIDYRFLAPMKKHFPRDYARVLEYFPLAELEIKRREYARRHTA